MALGSRLGKGFVEFFLKKDKFVSGSKSVVSTLVKMKVAMQAASRFARNVLIAGVAAAAGLVRMATRQIDAEAKLAAVLRATGNASGFTTRQLIRQAAALQKVTAFGDEVIINAQAILASFRNIKGDQFKGALEIAMDLSTELGANLKDSIIQVAKAMNDPAVGLTLLNRSGVTFSETQKKMISDFVKAGDLLSAQNLMLKEMRNQFGGLSRAMAKTDIGKFRQGLNRLGDAGERFGKAIIKQLVLLIPHMDRFATWIETLTRRDIDAFIEKAKTLGKVLIAVWAAPKLIAAMLFFIKTVVGIGIAMRVSAGVIGGVGVAAVTALATAYGLAVAQGMRFLQIGKDIEAASRSSADTFAELARLQKDLAAATGDKKRLAILKDILTVRKRIAVLAKETETEAFERSEMLLSGQGAKINLKNATLRVNRASEQLNKASEAVRLAGLGEQIGGGGSGGGGGGGKMGQLAEDRNKLARMQLDETIKTRKAVERQAGGIKLRND